MSKVIEFVKRHKVDIAVGVIAVISGGVLFALSKKSANVSKIMENVDSSIFETKWFKEEKERIAKLAWSFGNVTDLWNESGNTHMIVENVRLADLGNFGQECLKLNDTTDETLTSIILGFDGDKLT